MGDILRFDPNKERKMNAAEQRPPVKATVELTPTIEESDSELKPEDREKLMTEEVPEFISEMQQTQDTARDKIALRLQSESKEDIIDDLKAEYFARYEAKAPSKELRLLTLMLENAGYNKAKLDDELVEKARMVAIAEMEADKEADKKEDQLADEWYQQAA